MYTDIDQCAALSLKLASQLSVAMFEASVTPSAGALGLIMQGFPYKVNDLRTAYQKSFYKYLTEGDALTLKPACLESAVDELCYELKRVKKTHQRIEFLEDLKDATDGVHSHNLCLEKIQKERGSLRDMLRDVTKILSMHSIIRSSDASLTSLQHLQSGSSPSLFKP